VTSYDAIVPAGQRFLANLGTSGPEETTWVCDCCRAVPDWLERLEIVSLEIGLLLSLYVAYRIALQRTSGVAQALRALTPWAALLVLLFAAGVWIILQPMQMRGLP
jgi:hypothetical protein